MKTKPGITGRGISWEILQSWWIALSFIALSWIGFFYITFKTKQRKWRNLAILFTVLQLGFFIGIGIAQQLKLNIIVIIFVSIWLIAYFAGIIVSFIVRKEYLICLDVLEESDTDKKKTQVLKNKIVSEYREEGIIDKMPTHDDKVKIKTDKEQPKTDTFVDNGNAIIDINTCSELDFINLPGFNTLMAKEAVAYRKAHDGFSSIDEFFNVLNIKPHLIAQIQNKITCGFAKKKDKLDIHMNGQQDKPNRKLDF